MVSDFLRVAHDLLADLGALAAAPYIIMGLVLAIAGAYYLNDRRLDRRERDIDRRRSD